MPFAGFKNFEDCVSKNKEKDNPQAYCAAIQKQAESVKLFKNIILEYSTPIEAIQLTADSKKNLKIPEGATPVHGTAIRVTTSKNGIRYLEEELVKAAGTFIGRPIIKDHEAKIDNVLGRVTHSYYTPAKQEVEFDGWVKDPSVQEKIEDGRVNEVSIRASVEQLLEEDIDGVTAPTARGMKGEELSFVVIPGVEGASLSNSFDGAVCEAYQKMQLKVKQMANELIEKKETITKTEVKEEVKPEAVKVEVKAKEEMPQEPTPAQPAQDPVQMILAKLDKMMELMMQQQTETKHDAEEPEKEKPAESKKESEVKESNVQSKVIGEAKPKTEVSNEATNERKLFETHKSPSGAIEYVLKHDYQKYRR